MRRFYIDPLQISGTKAVLTGSQARHLSSVLRLAVGTPIHLFDGTGMIYQARIKKIDKGRVEATVFSSLDESQDSAVTLHVGQGLLKGKKMDFIVQKAVELGVKSLHPFLSRYCSAQHLSPDREERRQERWQRIALEACKQCGRAEPPDCLPLTDFADILAQVSASGNVEKKLLFWEGEKARTLETVFEDMGHIRSVMILIGPEGGFSEEEAGQGSAAGFQTVTLGRRILRAETASLAAVSILQYLLGNFR